MSKSSVEELTMERRLGYLPPLRAPYDTDYNYNTKINQQPIVGNQQYLSSNACTNSERMDRNSGERLSSEYISTSNDRVYMEELLRRQQRWVMGLMESSFRRISDDVLRTSTTVRRHEQILHELNLSYGKLDKYYGAVVEELTTRSNSCDKRIKEINEDIKRNKDNIEKVVQQETIHKKEIEDHIMKNNAEYILELSKVRAEIEGLRTSYKKDITVGDERRRIEIDDARSRIQALDSYTKNSLHTLKNAVQEALGRTETKISDGFKEERLVWRQNMDSMQKQTNDQMERLDQSISIIEEEAKRLIDAVVKKLENVQDVVTTEKSTNEEFRKVMKNHMDTNKAQSERLAKEVDLLKEEGSKVQELETSIESLRSVVEGRYNIVLEKMKKENDKLDSQIQKLSSQVQSLQQQLLSSGAGPSGSG